MADTVDGGTIMTLSALEYYYDATLESGWCEKGTRRKHAQKNK